MPSTAISVIRSNRSLTILLLTAAVLATTLGLGVFDQAQSQAAQTANPKLEEKMSAIKRSMRKLRRQLKDSSKNAESLTVVLTMQEAASASKVMEPTKAGSLEGDAKKTFLDEYRLAMCDMQKQLLDLEKLLIQGKNDEAQELYQKINQSQRPAHKKFRD